MIKWMPNIQGHVATSQVKVKKDNSSGNRTYWLTLLGAAELYTSLGLDRMQAREKIPNQLSVLPRGPITSSLIFRPPSETR